MSKLDFDMKTNPLAIMIALVALLGSCEQKHMDKLGSVSTDSLSTDSVSIKDECYSYYISDNVIIKSTVLPTDFNRDSIDSYKFVKDYEGNVYQATLIDTKKPPIFQEGIYPDVTNGKRKFFIYANDTYSCNLIYIGILLSSDQLLAASFIPQQAHSDTVVATRRVDLETPTQEKMVFSKERNRKMQDEYLKLFFQE